MAPINEEEPMQIDHGIEKVFDYMGYTCVILFSQLGHRCGYLGVGEESPLYERDVEDDSELSLNGVYLNVHGGITYIGGDPDYPIKTAEQKWWMGFDCGHAGDLPDMVGAKKILKSEIYERLIQLANISFPYGGATIKDQEYVEGELKNLALQVQEAEIRIETALEESEASLADLKKGSEKYKIPKIRIIKI